MVDGVSGSGGLRPFVGPALTTADKSGLQGGDGALRTALGRLLSRAAGNASSSIGASRSGPASAQRGTSSGFKKQAARMRLAAIKAQMLVLAMGGGDPKDRAKKISALLKELAQVARDYAAAGSDDAGAEATSAASDGTDPSGAGDAAPEEDQTAQSQSADAPADGAGSDGAGSDASPPEASQATGSPDQTAPNTNAREPGSQGAEAAKGADARSITPQDARPDKDRSEKGRSETVAAQANSADPQARGAKGASTPKGEGAAQPGRVSSERESDREFARQAAMLAELGKSALKRAQDDLARAKRSSGMETAQGRKDIADVDAAVGAILQSANAGDAAAAAYAAGADSGAAAAPQISLSV